jgi:hypothetical protein
VGTLCGRPIAIRPEDAQAKVRSPAPPPDPLLALDTFFLSPHVAGFTDVSISRVTDVIAEPFSFHGWASSPPARPSPAGTPQNHYPNTDSW